MSKGIDLDGLYSLLFRHTPLVYDLGDVSPWHDTGKAARGIKEDV